MSGPATSPIEHERRHRKVHRNIHSCLECKRRKVRCQLNGKNVAACEGCLNRGLSCIFHQDNRDENINVTIDFSDKLDRIECLLEKLVGNESSAAFAVHPRKPLQQRPSPIEYDIMKTNSTEFHEGRIDNSIDGKPYSSFGILKPSELNNSVEDRRQSRGLENIRKSLCALLPSQYVVDLIGAATNGWALVQVLCTQANDLFKNDDPLSSLNLVAVSKRHPTIIARTLLYITICMQQLPPEFDLTQLSLLHSPDQLMETYVSVVTDLVTSDDNLVTNIEGLECLLLQGLFHLNAGNLRRTWLSFRRALNIAQLMSLDKDFLRARSGLITSSTKAGKQMWHQVVMSDRYVSLLLGLPCGAGDNCFGPEETLSGANNEDIDFIFERRLCLIAGHICKRPRNKSSLVYSDTQIIDEDMDRLATEMPQSWWDIPILSGKSRSLAVAQQFNRLMSQMWYYQLQTLLHLPFMLHAGTERRHEYSNLSCLRASRGILLRYLAFRHVNNTQLLCRVVDFATFIASLTMILCLLQPSQVNKVLRCRQREQDLALLQQIILSMGNLARSSNREVVAKQSVEVLRTLMKLNDNSGASRRNLRLAIPYFGTITIICPAHIQCLEPTKSIPLVQDIQFANSAIGTEYHPAASWPNILESYTQNSSSNFDLVYSSVVSFTSTQFPWLQSEVETENSESQAEVFLLFDSILDSDIGRLETF